MAFDFNREVHRIEMVKKDPGKTRDYRYALKVHYLVYPAALPYYGYVLAWLTSVYDTIARLAFLKAIKPKTMLERGLWAIIMVSTKIFFLIFRAAGNSGAFSFVIAASIFTNFIPTTFPVFLTTTSFIHYFIYMGTYYHQKTLGDQMNYEGFKHTVMFYKAVAFFQMILIYYKATVTVGSPDWLSLGLIALGFGLSGSAAAAIGIDRTYFGIELGKCKPEYVTTFPYNILQRKTKG